VKISRITLQNFRAFDESFELDLDGGKNLLLHGENGSGKSSIYFALKRFFEERGDDIVKHRNHFSPDTKPSHVRIRINGQDASGTQCDQEFNWDIAAGHPLPVPKASLATSISKEQRSLLIDGARRAGFLDYRAMLQTHIFSSPLSRSNRGPAIHEIVYGAESKGLDAQLFDLISLVILAGVRVSISSSGEATIGELMRRVWQHRPGSRRKSALAVANSYANAFNQAFNAKIPELEMKLGEFLSNFENNDLSLKLEPVSLAWDKPTLMLVGAELLPKITFRGKLVADHHQFLNEARLSALAICLFLAGVKLSDNDYDNPAYPRFLVLDDTLIGLELQNRLPVLNILTSDAFKNYQIFLLTYDSVWFDLAKGHLREKDGWLHKELLADETTGKLIPRHKPSATDIERAASHLGTGDLKAAAVYARSALEWKLRIVCEKHGIKLAFKPDADRIGAGALWEGIVQRQRERETQRKMGSQVPDLVPPSLETDVEIMRSTVLNKLSHTGASGLVKSEVAAAILTIGRIMEHPFPKA